MVVVVSHPEVAIFQVLRSMLSTALPVMAVDVVVVVVAVLHPEEVAMVPVWRKVT